MTKSYSFIHTHAYIRVICLVYGHILSRHDHIFMDATCIFIGNIEDYEEKFNKDDVENSFKYMLDKLEKLWSDVELSRLKRTCIRDVRLSKKIKKNVKSTDTLGDTFDILANTPFCTWLDIRILNSMADIADNLEASEMLAAFEKCVHHRKCSEVIGYFRKQQFRNPKHFAKVIAKLNKKADCLNVAKLIEYSQRLENVLHLPPDSNTVVGSEFGCLEIHLIIPKYCLLHAYETSKNCFLKLRPFNVQYLQIGTFSKVYTTNLTRTMQAESLLEAISSNSDCKLHVILFKL